MSITGGLGQTMGDAAYDAMLGHAIGEANGTAHLAIQRANQWHDYARQLEAQVQELKASVAEFEDYKEKAHAKMTELYERAMEEFAWRKRLQAEVAELKRPRWGGAG